MKKVTTKYHDHGVFMICLFLLTCDIIWLRCQIGERVGGLLSLQVPASLAQLGNFGTSKAWAQVVSSMIRPRMPHLQNPFDEAIDD